MHKKILIQILLVSVIVGLGFMACKGQTPAAGPVYSVDKYDPSRSAAADLDATVQQARQSGKRILMEVGGNWCGWCRALEKFMHDTPSVASALRAHYIILKINMSEENRNQEFLSHYPKVKGYPHIFVLDTNGTLLHSQDTGPLEEAKSYNEKRVLDFLSQWAPKS